MLDGCLVDKFSMRTKSIRERPGSRHSIILKDITGSSEFYFVEFDCPAAAAPLSEVQTIRSLERLESQREMKKKRWTISSQRWNSDVPFGKCRWSGGFLSFAWQVREIKMESTEWSGSAGCLTGCRSWGLKLNNWAKHLRSDSNFALIFIIIPAPDFLTMVLVFLRKSQYKQDSIIRNWC